MGRDREPSAQVFGSMLDRDRWQIQQYGKVRNGFRDPECEFDDRPALMITEPFWTDQTERMAYESAVEEHLPGSVAEDGAPHYLERIVGIVTGRYANAGKTLPSRYQSHRERDARLAKLREQAARLPYRDDAA